MAGRARLRARSIALIALFGLTTQLTLLAGPARAADVATTQSGPWSDPASWSTGTVPAAGDVVTIEPGHDVTYDAQSDAVLGGVTVMGTLRFSRDVSTRMKTGGNVIVEHGGFLDMGVPSDPIPAGVAAELFFVLTSAQADAYVGGMNFEPTDVGLWVMHGGRWETNGAPLDWSWAKLAADAPAGSSTVVLERDVTDWPVGGHVVISSSRNPKRFKPGTNDKQGITWETETRRVASVQSLQDGSSQVVLDQPLSFAHSGTWPYRADVGLLSRNVRLETTIVGRSEAGYANDVRSRDFAHTMFMHGALGSVRYTEFKFMGHYGKLSRYAMHAHLSQESGRNLVFEGNSGWFTGFRCVNVHASFGVTVIDNVCYSSASAAFYGEDAPDEGMHNADNVFVHNLAVATRPKDFADRHADSGVAGEDYLISAFWPANAARHEAYLGNVAADTHGYSLNVEHASGFHFPATGNAPPDFGTMPWTFVANEAHGNEDHGINTWQNGVPARDVVGSLIWRNGVSGIRWGAYSGKNRYFNAQILENGVFGLDITAVESFLQDSRVLGATADGSRDDVGYRINSYVISQGPLRPLWIVRNHFERLPTAGFSVDHTPCGDPAREVRPVIAGECSGVFATLIRNTFSADVPRPIDFGWQANANSFWRVFDQPLFPGGPDDAVMLRKDQSDEAVRTPLTGALVTAESTYQAGPDALHTPMSALPATILYEDLPNGDEPPLPFDYTFTTAQDEPPSAPGGGPPALTVTWDGSEATMRVDAADDRATPRVEFLVDWQVVATDAEPPYEATVDLAGYPRKIAYLYARALDGTPMAQGEQRAYTNVVEVGPGTILPPDTTEPTVFLTAPGEGARVRGTAVPFTATAWDNGSVARVEFLVDGTEVAEDVLAPYGFSWDTTGLSDGSHLLEARAVDEDGNEATDSAQVSVDNGAPSVSITEPAEGALICKIVNVAVEASDGVGVAGVELLVDGVAGVAGPSDTSAPFAFSLDTATLTDAPHTLSARAFDAAGNQATASVLVTVDNAAPAVTLTAPPSDAFLRDTAIVTADATDPSGVSLVAFVVDGVTQVPNDPTFPYEFAWDTTGVPDGPHTLRARAKDAPGNVAVTPLLPVTVDNTLPAVTLTAPAHGSTVKGTVTASASASDTYGVTGVEFLVDGAVRSTDTTGPGYTFAWDTTAEPFGSHTVQARAIDRAGNRAETPVATVTVDNRPPPDLVVQIGDAPDPVGAGDDLTYTVTVRNGGGSGATGVSARLPVPAGASWRSTSSSQGTCSGTGTVTCTLGAIDPGATATVSVVVSRSSVGALSATASATAAETEATTANNQATATTQVAPNAAGCTIVGTPGDDIIAGTWGPDVICGGGGNDRLSGGIGNDQLRGDAGNDTLTGYQGSDTLNGGTGTDSHQGEAGNDTLQAKDGVGNEVVNGGSGTDSCTADPTDRRSSCP